MTHETPKLLFFTLLFLVVMVLQTGGFFRVGGVEPNFILVFAVFVALLALSIKSFIALLVLQVLLAWAGMPFWFFAFLPLVGVSLLVRVLRFRLTGNLFFDFMLTIALVTLLRYAAFAFPFLSWGSWTFVAEETALNLLVGALLWVVLRNFLIRHAKVTP